MKKLSAVLEISNFFVQGGGCTYTLGKWVGIFQVGIFQGESLMGGNLPGGNFPTIHKNID